MKNQRSKSKLKAPQVGLAFLRKSRVAVEYAKGHILCAAPFESYDLTV